MVPAALLAPSIITFTASLPCTHMMFITTTSVCRLAQIRERYAAALLACSADDMLPP